MNLISLCMISSIILFGETSGFVIGRAEKNSKQDVLDASNKETENINSNGKLVENKSPFNGYEKESDLLVNNAEVNPLDVGKDYYMLVPVQEGGDEGVRPARDAIPNVAWEIPNQIRLNDGIRTISVNRVTLKPIKKRKSVPLMIWGDDAEKDIDSPLQLDLVEPTEKLFSLVKNTERVPKKQNKVNDDVQLPINIDFRISNLIPSCLVNSIDLHNSSSIDKDGNMFFSIQILKCPSTTTTSKTMCPQNPPCLNPGCLNVVKNMMLKNATVHQQGLEAGFESKKGFGANFSERKESENDKQILPGSSGIRSGTIQPHNPTDLSWLMQHFNVMATQKPLTSVNPPDSNLLLNQNLFNQLEKVLKVENNTKDKIVKDDNKLVVEIVNPNQSREIHPNLFQVKKKKAISEAIDLLARALGKKALVDK